MQSSENAKTLFHGAGHVCKGLHFVNVTAYIDIRLGLATGRRRDMPLIGAIILFAVFALNVGLGAFTGSAFMSDIAEMLVLIGTAVLFVVAIIQKEAAAKK